MQCYLPWEKTGITALSVFCGATDFVMIKWTEISLALKIELILVGRTEFVGGTVLICRVNRRMLSRISNCKKKINILLAERPIFKALSIVTFPVSAASLSIT